MAQTLARWGTKLVSYSVRIGCKAANQAQSKFIRFRKERVDEMNACFLRLVLWRCIIFFFTALAITSRPHLQTFWGHARVELLPPSPSEFGEVRLGLSRVYNTAVTRGFMKKTMKEVVQYTLVGTEICCWLFVGEMIGRKSVIGYRV